MHVAAVLVVFGGLYSIFAKQKVVVMAGYDEPAMLRGFPYALTLKDFRIARNESGSPLDYTSVIEAKSLDGQVVEATVSVNAPARLGHWRIYQQGYDVAAGEQTSYSVLQCVKDPLYPLIAIGLWLLIVSAALYALYTLLHVSAKGWIWAATAVVFALFVYSTMKSVGIGSRDLVPVLRSGWFIPHIVSYMFAYAMLAVTTMLVAVLAVRSRRHEVSRGAWLLGRRFCSVGWAFLTIGMCMGALWAKQSWGDWWTFDPKETWALLTWIAFGAYFHLEPRMTRGWKVAVIIAAFLLLNMCWWGVNLLPSAGSLHTYAM